MIKSVMNAKVEIIRNIMYEDPQCPGVEGLQNLCGGTHWKMAASVFEASIIVYEVAIVDGNLQIQPPR